VPVTVGQGSVRFLWRRRKRGAGPPRDAQGILGRKIIQ
jgi:hypothetical protein